MTTPTPKQVEHVQGNIKNMMDWVNHLHDYLQDIISETYAYISLDSKKDPGQTFVSDLINVMILGGASQIPKVGSGLGSFLGGLFKSFINDPPPSLDGAMASVWDRFSKSYLAANHDLAQIYNDVSGKWDKSFTDPTTGKTVAVSAWGDAVTVPSSTSNEYQTMTEDAVAAYKVALAKELLPVKYQVVSDTRGLFLKGKSEKGAIRFIKKWEKKNPAAYMQAAHDTGGKICPHKGFSFAAPFLGYGSSDPMFAHTMPKETCDWLIKDDGWGKITNPHALATRADVFCRWKLKCSMDYHKVGKIARHGWDIPDGCTSKGDVRPEEDDGIPDDELVRDQALAARWHEAFAAEPRAQMEQRIIDRALADPVFSYELLNRPKETVSAFLGIPLPEHVTFEVIQERADEYKLILPYAGNEQRRTAAPEEDGAS